MRSLWLIFFFFPLWLSDCHTCIYTHTWRLLPVVTLSNFKVSELGLLKFTAFIMTCPTSVHQLKRSEPHPVVWPKITVLIISAPPAPPPALPHLPSSNLFPVTYTEVVCGFFPAMSLRRHRFFYFVTLSWAVLVHCPYLRFRMFLLILPYSCSLPLPFVQDGD